MLLFLFIRLFEKSNLYFPMSSIEATPESIGLDYEKISLMTSDGIMIAGWFIQSKKPRATLLFCHGNAGNISHRLEKIRILNRLDLNILIFDYRGYGRSEGSPSEHGLYIDAETAYRYLINIKKISPEMIVVFGESLGAAVAVDLAYKHYLGGIIIEGGFPSVRDMAKKLFPFIPGFVYKNRFDSLKKIKHIKSPKLIFHSLEDEIVPFELGEKIFRTAVEPKKLIKLQGGHNDAFMSSYDIFVEEIDSFIEGL